MSDEQIPKCRCWTLAKWPTGEPAPDQVFQFDLLRQPPDDTDSWSTEEKQRSTDAAGLVEINLPIGAVFRYRWAPRGAWKKFTVPNAPDFKLPPINDGR